MERNEPDVESLARHSSPNLKILFVPDSIYWVLGTNAKAIARHNPWIQATIVSGPVLDRIAAEDSRFFDRFDLVHFICPYASKRWLPVLRDKLPVVTSHHHVTDWSAISHNLEGDAIVTGSMEWADDIASRGADPERVVSVPYGVDTRLFTPGSESSRNGVRRRLGLELAEPIIGFFAKRGSNDDDRKGIDVFTEAVALMHPRSPNAGVLIVGPGWKELVDNLRARGIVCAWLPFLEKLEDVAPLYHALDFYWVTARVEGGPVPLLEAMSSAVCCLTTRVGLAREIVEDGVNAVFLPMNDPRAFAVETLRLWNDREARVSIAARARETIVERMHVGDTLQGVSQAYALAFDNFAARTGRRAASAAMPDVRPSSGEVSGDGVPLDALDPRERRRVSMLEALEWSENLVLYQRQYAAALRLIVKAWARNPVSPEPMRVFLRRFLPASFVRSVVQVKRVTARAAHAMAMRRGAAKP